MPASVLPGAVGRPAAGGRPVLVYDGDCGFCTSAARWAERGFGATATALPWQGLGDDGLRALGLTRDQVARAAWWVGPEGRPLGGHLAVAAALSAGGGWRRPAGRVLRTPPVRWGASVAYRFVSRYRHHLPGGTPACRADR